MDAAARPPGLTVLATSRWALPDWDGEQLELYHASYGDFLQMAQALAQRGQLPAAFLAKRENLYHVYNVLGGNSRALEFFAAALKNMKSASEEDAFLASLAHSKKESQADMAIEAIYAHLTQPAQNYSRLPAYPAVPAEGILNLGLDLTDEPRILLEQLRAVSLIEAQVEVNYEVIQYQCVPLVLDWLREQNLIDNDPQWGSAAADYHLYLHHNERDGLTQAMAAHEALRRVGRAAEADRLALDHIVGPLTMAGFYVTILTEWLPLICASEDLQVRGEALGGMGSTLHRRGDFENALPYMKQSLTIRQQIGDKAGEAHANNISQILSARRVRDSAWVPETIADHQAANRRQSGRRRHAQQYFRVFRQGYERCT